MTVILYSIAFICVCLSTVNAIMQKFDPAIWFAVMASVILVASTIYKEENGD